MSSRSLVHRLRIAALGMFLLALIPASAGAQPRHDVCADLGSTFGFGISYFGAAGDWLVEAHDTYGAEWRYVYWYVLLSSDPVAARRDWIRGKAQTAHRIGAIPVLTFYQLLHTGQRAGLTGREPDVVRATLERDDLMRSYFERFVEVLGFVADLSPVIVQVEPDSWGFMIWAMGVDGNDDATSVPVSVAASGYPGLDGFPDHAGGFGQALLALRNTHAPDVRLGWHASNFRGGARPEVTVGFYSGMGDWDVLFGEPPHLEADPAQWWEPWDEGRVSTNLTWLQTVTRGAGLPIVLWQMPIGPYDWHWLQEVGGREHMERFARAGVAGIALEHLGTRGSDPDGFRALGAWAAVPPADSPADGTAAGMRARVAEYSRLPLPLPVEHPCGEGAVRPDGGIAPPADGGTLQRDGGTLRRDGGTLRRDGGALRDSGARRDARVGMDAARIDAGTPSRLGMDGCDCGVVGARGRRETASGTVLAALAGLTLAWFALERRARFARRGILTPRTGARPAPPA